MDALLSVTYLVLGALALIAVTMLRHPRIFGQFLRPLAGFVAMGPALGLPQLLLLGPLGALAVGLLGGLSALPGQVGLGLHGLAWLELLLYAAALDRALPRLDGEPVADEGAVFGRDAPLIVRWVPFLTWRVGGQVELTPDLVYREVDGIRLRLDVYRATTAGPPRPPLIYVHGGGWISGTRRHALTLGRRLASEGWTVFAISYRLAPRFPVSDAIADVKAAIVWARAQAPRWGALDAPPMLMGGSAGGHLAALAALTPHRADLQPGFEQADARVGAAAVLYGVTDLESAFEERPHPGVAWFIERMVVQRRRAEAPERFAALNPIKQRPPELPPLLVVHGDRDDLVSPGLSRRFVQALRAAGAARVHLLEVPEAAHSFDLVPSPLQQRTLRVISAFYEFFWRDAQSSSPPSSAVSSPVSEPGT